MSIFYKLKQSFQGLRQFTGSSIHWFARNPLVLLVFAVAVARLIMLGSYPLMDTTEARYGDIGRMMAESGDWITPWFRPGVPFWGKPPLSFWCTALSFKLFGVNEFTARLPHWILGVLGGWLVWDLAARRSIREAVIAVSLLTGCLIYYFSSGAVMTDMALTLGLTLSMWSFWLAVQPDQLPGLHNRARWLFFVSLGWGLLAKGPLAPVLAGLAIGAWLLASRSYGPAVRRLPWVRGLILSLAIAAPWYWAAEQKTPGFLNYFLIGEHIKRFLIPGWNGDLYGNAHIYPRGMIWLFLLLMLIPWTVIIPGFLCFGTGKKPSLSPPLNSSVVPIDSNQIAWRNYLLAWGLMPAAFFTFASNIIMPYVLPGIPAIALLGGYYLVRKDPRRVNQLLATGLSIVLVVSLVFVIVFPFTGYGERKSERSLIQYYQSRLANGGINAGINGGINSANKAAPLVYLGQYPFSASFYSNGNLSALPTPSDLIDRLDKQDTPIVAISNDQDPEVSSLIQERLKKVKAFRRYTLYAENPDRPVPSAKPQG
jgi:4-amino-4-deoxy-L-arabinose transferase-like glycosyltransferase